MFTTNEQFLLFFKIIFKNLYKNIFRLNSINQNMYIIIVCILKFHITNKISIKKI